MFDSIDGAARCAVKLQQQIPIADADQPPDRAIRFRVGINIGDAIADGTDLHGDAVNVAARLQAECRPGGICVTRSVRDHVHGRLDLAFEGLGTLNLKNISRPAEAFLLRPNLTTTTSHFVEQSPVLDTSRALPFPDRPSIAVLPFQNMSGDPACCFPCPRGRHTSLAGRRRGADKILPSGRQPGTALANSPCRSSWEVAV
jgi:adenylate cyclase